MSKLCLQYDQVDLYNGHRKAVVAVVVAAAAAAAALGEEVL